VVFHPGETASEHGEAAHDEAAGKDPDGRRSAQGVDSTTYARLPFRPCAGRHVPALSENAGGQPPAEPAQYFGKDRTAWGVAVVHRLLGVHHDDVMEDYLLTNTAAIPKRGLRQRR